MQLIYFSLMISALVGPIVFRTNDPHYQEIASPLLTPLIHTFHESFIAVIACIGLLSLQVRFAGWRGERRVIRNGNLRSVWDRFMVNKAAVLWIWVVISPTFLHYAGWLAVPKAETWMTSSYLVLLFWWAFPTLLLTVLIDISQGRLLKTINGYVHQRSSCDESSRVALQTGSDGSRDSKFRKASSHLPWHSVQHGWLAVALPTLIACAFIDAFLFTESALRNFDAVAITWYPVIARVGIIALAFLTIAALFPLLIVRIWSEPISINSQFISPSIRSLWKSIGGRESQLRMWRTNNRISGGMVVGWLFPWRYLLLSDRLLRESSPAMLRMVVLHEIGHIERYHGWLRILPVLFGGLALAMVVAIGNSWVVALSVIAILAGQTWLLSRISHWTERDADRWAVEKRVDEIYQAIAVRKTQWGESHSGKFPSNTNQLSMKSVNRDGSDHSDDQSRDVKHDWADLELNSISLGRFESPEDVRHHAAKAMVDALKQLVPSRYHAKTTWLHPSVENRANALLSGCHGHQSSVVESASSGILLSG